jgi:hypothetical protein
MGRFQHGDFVKHKASEVHVFQVLFELESVPPGLPSLYRCMPLDDEVSLHNYSEADLYKVVLSDEEFEAIYEGAQFSDAPHRFSSEQFRIAPIFTGRTFEYRKSTCFLLMPFTQDWSERVYKQISKVLKKLGYSTLRADDLYGHDVLEDIWRALNESEIVIADTTSKNPNVFYEIGIAHTLGKRLILLAQDAEDIPFDLRRYRHLIYEDNVDGFATLSRQLTGYIQ